MPQTTDRDQTGVPFLDLLRRESARFREVLADAPAGLRVPTCPDWDTDDLLWHLGDVQWFWGEIAGRRLTDSADLDEMKATRPGRPTDRAGLLAFYDEFSSRLHRELSSMPPGTELYMWWRDHSAGYIARRQAHEALIHRVDAEVTAGVEPGDRADIDAALAADGIDEVLRIMRVFQPEPGLQHEVIAGKVAIAAVDTMHTWTVTPVYVTGTDSDGGAWDEAAFLVDDEADPDVTTQICGTAGDLDCWLWNRPAAGELTRRGDDAALAGVDQVLSDSID